MEKEGQIDSFRSWINNAYKELLNQEEIGLDEIQKYMEVISINEYLYPEHGWLGDFEGSQFARRFFLELLVNARGISDQIPIHNRLLFREHLRNLICLLRIETEADYNGGEAQIASEVIRDVGEIYSDDNFSEFCTTEADFICPEVYDRAHRLGRGETLAQILEG